MSAAYPLDAKAPGLLALDLQPLDATASPAVLPYDLAAAIESRYVAAGGIAGVTQLYESQAGDRAILPYVVYKIVDGGPLLTTDVHYIFDQRVQFTAYDSTQEDANTRRNAVAALFGNGAYEFRTGFSIPFFQVNQREGKEPLRGPKSGYVYRAEIHYSARTHRS